MVLAAAVSALRFNPASGKPKKLKCALVMCCLAILLSLLQIMSADKAFVIRGILRSEYGVTFGPRKYRRLGLSEKIGKAMAEPISQQISLPEPLTQLLGKKDEMPAELIN